MSAPCDMALPPDIHRPVDRRGARCDLMSSLLILWHRRHGFLMQRRSADAPVMPSSVGFFGGGIRQGETPYQAALREMDEELGLHGTLTFFRTRTAPVEPDHLELAFFFSAELQRDGYQAFEGDGTLWVDPSRPPAGLHRRDRDTLLGFLHHGDVPGIIGFGA